MEMEKQIVFSSISEMIIRKYIRFALEMVTTLNWEHLMTVWVLKYGERILPETGKMRSFFVESIQEIHGYRGSEIAI